MVREISLLNLELRKWKYHASQCEEGMSPLREHKKSIKELRKRCAKELFFEKICWDRLQEELKELWKFKGAQNVKEKMQLSSRIVEL